MAGDQVEQIYYRNGSILIHKSLLVGDVLSQKAEQRSEVGGGCWLAVLRP